MLRLLKRYKTALVIFVVILVPLLVYRANTAMRGDANGVDKVIMAVTAPVQRALSWLTAEVSDAWFHYVDLMAARRENSELKRALARAERDRDVRQGIEVENRHLRDLIGLRETNPSRRFLAAAVIGAGSSALARTIDIDRGSLDGVRRGMVVVAEVGLVGLVQRVGWTSAEIVLIADQNISIRTVIVRTRAQGRVRGSGQKPVFALELTEVLRPEDMQVGDRVEASGLGGVFPRGAPIGVVTSVRVVEGAQHRVADVEPYVDFARLEHVMVLLDLGESETVVTPPSLRPAALRTRTATTTTRVPMLSTSTTVTATAAAATATATTSPDAEAVP